LKRNRKPTPGKSQWSNIRTIATRSLSKPENLPNDLESFCRETLRRKQWNNQIKNGKSLDVAIIQKIGDRPDYSKSLTLRLAAIEMVRRIQNQDKTNR